MSSEVGAERGSDVEVGATEDGRCASYWYGRGLSVTAALDKRRKRRPRRGYEELGGSTHVQARTGIVVRSYPGVPSHPVDPPPRTIHCDCCYSPSISLDTELRAYRGLVV